ncbi:MAG: hypothetical protein V4599_01780 [Verrucomicrobiota bacterium]
MSNQNGEEESTSNFKCGEVVLLKSELVSFGDARPVNMVVEMALSPEKVTVVWHSFCGELHRADLPTDCLYRKKMLTNSG